VLGSDYATQTCSIARALEAVGERWTLLIVRELLLRPSRFTDLLRRLGISRNILISRLTKLVDLEIVHTVNYAHNRDWNTYELTDKGKDLFPIISALMAWGDRYAAPNGPPAIFEHSCGHPVGHRLVCQTCDQPVSAETIHAVVGPGYRPSRPL